MKKFILFLSLVLFLSCSKKIIVTKNVPNTISKEDVIIRYSSEDRIMQVNVVRKGRPTIPLILKYKTSGIKALLYGNDKYNELLDEVLYFYEDDNGEHFLGKVNRDGVYDKNDVALFLTSESYMKEGYVYDVILNYPTSVNYLWFEYDKKYIDRHIGELHVTFEPVILLDFDLESMTLTKFIPNI